MKNTSIKPVRVQRLRKKGFKLQDASPNGLPVVYVGRPTKWGNPLKLVGDMIYINASWRRKILDPWVYFKQGTIEDVVKYYDLLLNGERLELFARQNHTGWDAWGNEVENSIKL